MIFLNLLFCSGDFFTKGRTGEEIVAWSLTKVLNKDLDVAEFQILTLYIPLLTKRYQLFHITWEVFWVTLESQYSYSNSPDWSPYSSLKNKLIVFLFVIKDQSFSPLVIMFSILINLFSWLCIDYVGRKLTFITLGT